MAKPMERRASRPTPGPGPARRPGAGGNVDRHLRLTFCEADGALRAGGFTTGWRSLPMTVVENTCFDAGVRVLGEHPAIVSVGIAQGGVEHVLYEDQLAPGEDHALPPLALFDFDGRSVELVVGVRPAPGGESRVRLLGPRLHACSRSEQRRSRSL